jgi:FtsP/CotA-like multicopper oxidase with cupredoxin domain/peroxiredoxin
MTSTLGRRLSKWLLLGMLALLLPQVYSLYLWQTPAALPASPPSGPASGSEEASASKSPPPVAERSDVEPQAKPLAPAPDENMAEEWRDGNAYVLRVQKTRVALPGAAADGGPSQADLITYNGRPVGPTIRVRRGSTLCIKLINELVRTQAPPLIIEAKPWVSSQEEPPHDLFSTNLHTHGLHVSPEGNSDNIFREIPPGGSFQYTIAIPADHPTGTFWYHPHHHGSVAYQLGNGLAGVLIVEGDSSPRKSRVRDLDEVPEIAAARERILLLQQLILERDSHGVGWVDPYDIYHDQPRPGAYEAIAINGVVQPTYTMRPGEVQRWRIINAGRAGYQELRWYNERGMELRTMPFSEIALDGLARGALVLRRSVTLYPGSRSDVLVKAPAARGSYFLCALQEDEASGSEKVKIRRLAQLVVAGRQLPMNMPAAAELATCKPFASIEAAECTVRRNVVFQYDDKRKIFRINGLSFSQQKQPEQAVLGAAEEWTLSAEAPAEGQQDEPHPFHVHVNPFEVVKIENLQTGAVYPVSEWRDTIAVESGKRVTIRLRWRDFAGKTVFHCHTLDHEDQGMMHTIRIVDPRKPAADPEMTLSECAVPAPPLRLPTIQGRPWQLQGCGHHVVLLFFRGMSCVHCVAELRKLIQTAGELDDARTMLVAVSSEPIEDPARAFQALKVPPNLKFTLLIDEHHAAFRAFGCYADAPLHGLFLINRTGTIRARYAGEAPFDDSQAICVRVRQLDKQPPVAPVTSGWEERIVENRPANNAEPAAKGRYAQ